MAARQRLDAEMVRRHLADSRSQAGQLIDDGAVLVSGAVAAKASRLVHPGEPIVLTERPRFVSRGGDKLAGALDAAGLTVLHDDRDKVSPGVKFKDAELIGVPTIVVVGRGLADGVVEVKDRATGERENVPVGEAAAHLVGLVRG